MPETLRLKNLSLKSNSKRLILIALLSGLCGLMPLFASDGFEAPVVFTRNEGQWNDGSLYHYQQGVFQAVFYKDRVSFATSRLKDPHQTAVKKQIPGQQQPEDPRVMIQVWEIRYLNASPFTYVAEDLQPSISGFVNQNTGSAIIYPRQAATLRVNDVYPGVSLIFSNKNGQLKLDYELRNAAAAEQIRFHIAGFLKTGINAKGSIEMQSTYGTITDSIPSSYPRSKPEISIPASYRSLGDNTFGLNIEAGEFGSDAIIVDPFYLDYSTYFYGTATSGWTYIYDVEVDEGNNSYISGYTTDKYPGTPGTYDTTLSGTADGFLAKIGPNGGQPKYIIYLGGSNMDYVYAVAATAKGDCYLTGYTVSNDFPVTSGVLEPTKPLASTYTSYVTGIKSDGSALIYSTYIKGYSWVVDVNELGQVYIAPYGDNPYPVTRNINPPGQVGGNLEANIIRLNSAGSAILNCVALIGSGVEYVYGLTIDKRNQVYAAGWTNSDNLPVTPGQKNFGGFYKGGGYDGFLFKVDSAFTKYLISKYIGTSGYDYLSAITVNDDEDIFIQGIAGANDLPAATNSFPGGSTTGWNGSAFIMRIYKNGIFPRWTTYITNNTWAWRQRISVTAKDECVFAGTTWSNSLPVTSDAFQKTFKGGYDGYAGKLDINGSFKYLTYYGGGSTDYLFAVQTKRIGCVTQLIMGGYCQSTDFPLKLAWKTKPTGSFWWSGAVVKWRDTLKVDPIDLGPDVVNCDRNYRILEAGNPGASFKWQNGDTLKYFIVDRPGKYWVTATYGCGFKSDSVTFSTVPSAKAWMPKDSIICDKYSVLLDARNDTIKGIRYLWSTGDTTQKIKVTKSGKYKVGMWTPVCQWRYDSIEIIKQYVPRTGIDQRDTLLCRPFTKNIKAGLDSVEAYYIWNTGDTTAQVSISQRGKYVVSVRNLCGTLNDSVRIQSDTIPVIRFTTDSLLCDRDSLLVSRAGFSPGTTLTWSDGSADSVRIFRQSGTYLVKVANSCANYTDTVTLRFRKSPEPMTLVNILWCDTLKLSQVIPNNQHAKISWSTGDTGRTLNIKDTGRITVKASNECGEENAWFRVERGFSPVVVLGNDTLICNKPDFTIRPRQLKFAESLLWNTNDDQPDLMVNTNGVYTLTNFNKCGVAQDSIRVTFLSSPTLTMPAGKQFCDAVSGILTLKATAGGGSAVYSWSNGDAGLTTNVSSPGTYRLTASNGCGSVTDSTIIRVVPSPRPNLGPDTAFCGQFNYKLSAGSGWQLIEWSTGSNAPEINANQYATYRVKVTDNNGCSGSDEITIGSNCKLIWYVPGSFSPNGDGLNDVFMPVMKDVQQLKLFIYDRWGQLVWEGSDLQPGWDGRINGEIAQDGVYVWRAEYMSNFRRYYDKGTLTLLR